MSAFGSVIAVTRKVDLQTAEFLKGKFVEILLAPAFDDDALEFLKNKSKDIRLLEVGEIKKATPCKVYKHVIGGMLVQDRDIGTWEKFECVTKAQFPKNKEDLARFTWLVTKHTKSNAIVMCYEYKPGYFQVMGLGPGQPNRIDSNLRLCQPRVRDNVARLPEAKEFFDENGKLVNEAGLKALEKKVFGEVVMGSDAFFPFPDNVEAAHDAGVRYIVQPGGSKKDDLSIAISISIIFTILMMVFEPMIIKATGMSQLMGGALIGGTVDSTGAVVLAGNALGEEAEQAAVLVKSIQNILIGFIAFFVAIFFATKVDKDPNQKVGAGEIWNRFPKFIIGFFVASLVASFIIQPLTKGMDFNGASAVKAINGVLDQYKNWAFVLAFTSIGLDTNFKSLFKRMQGGKVLWLYIIGQVFNIALTLFAVWFLLSGKIFDIPSLDMFK